MLYEPLLLIHFLIGIGILSWSLIGLLFFVLLVASDNTNFDIIFLLVFIGILCGPVVWLILIIETIIRIINWYSYWYDDF